MMIKSILILLMIITYLVNAFVQSEVVEVILSFVAFAVLCVCLFQATRVSKIMGSILLTLGFMISMLANHSSFISSLNGLLQNLPLLTLMLVVPMIAIPLKVNGYISAAFELANGWKGKPRKAFLGLSGFITMISPILNVGSVRMLDDVVKKLKFDPELLARAYFTGFSTALVWSPYFGSIALVLYYCNVEVNDYIVIGLSFALAQLLTGNILYMKSAKRLELTSSDASIKPLEQSTREKGHSANIVKLLFILVSLITFILVLEELTKLPMLLLVSIIAIVFPFIWGLFTRNWKAIFKELGLFREKVTHESNNEVVLFLCAGLFGKALVESNISDWIESFLVHISSISYLFFAAIIAITVIFFAFIGIHQIITVPILAMKADPILLGVSPTTLAFTFILAWFMSSILSPFNAISIIISHSVKRSPIRVGIIWNGPYIVAMFIIGLLFISILRL